MQFEYNAPQNGSFGLRSKIVHTEQRRLCKTALYSDGFVYSYRHTQYYAAGAGHSTPVTSLDDMQNRHLELVQKSERLFKP